MLQSVASGLSESPPPEKLLKMHILEPYPKTTETEILWMTHSNNLIFTMIKKKIISKRGSEREKG